MTYICSIGTSIPEYNLTQTEIQTFIKEIFPRPAREVNRLLPVFDHAAVKNRQFVVEQSWFANEHSFQERNDIYQTKAIKHGVEAIDHCLSNQDFLSHPIPYDAIDVIIFVSSTGIATPSLDAYLLNERNFRDDVIRMPLWGLGCAGGASGLARAHDWLSSNREGSVLVVSVELCSLAFQKNDDKKSNFIGSALFGDGTAAGLLLGDKSPYLKERRRTSPKVHQTSTRLKKDALNVMGWAITDNGFEVIFAKSIPSLVKEFWREHTLTFFKQIDWSVEDISCYIAHPGGKKVLEAMEEVLDITKTQLHYSYKILSDHGNMSSVTVFYILNAWMKENMKQGEKSILSALGPGFSSELISLEWS
ncbi:type III polyketide synthase [Aquibacillus rhizosphaerae]|uniref:3-oxoacyl-[acyl-carrier-protein] synthase III C-terminal domain-containing protein n=1 Tax=Aquibacillus rhizosphaerae TaxID=3051431 RepID=A0ABT7L574_9BACI|nr:3-oxoacyl-[acyl-carrier-protein] synthase III C-terminal domain-containing protein [Aquibacillus sp. LR5S19]MDL4839736.1 3-oxoacyl-[acyl-carrier-protein] synthase III C-terminal domain-containing protein [Aquibacillus sp. LR5S19]